MLCTEPCQELCAISETAVHVGTSLMALKSPTCPHPEAGGTDSCGFTFRCKCSMSSLLLGIYILNYVLFYDKFLSFDFSIILQFGQYIDFKKIMWLGWLYYLCFPSWDSNGV